MIDVIGKKWLFLSVSGLLVVASIIGIATLGLRPGIDFTGGTLWQIAFPDGNVTRDDLVTFLHDDVKIADAVVTEETTNASFIVRAPEISEAEHQVYLPRLTEKFKNVEELAFQTIGAAVGGELRGKAMTAFILVLFGISIYIAFAFRKVSQPVSSWKYGVITLATLFHDALIPAGLFAVLGYLNNIEVDTNFIVAILVVMGFSVHDTIVVFDRVRENLKSADLGKTSFDDLVNRSVNQTMVRSINTSLTLVLVLLALYFAGAPALRYFILTIGVGTIVGTYSSIFVASPLLTLWRKR